MRFYLFIALVFVYTSGLRATTWYVNQNNTGIANGKNWATALPTVQRGLDSAKAGDTVCIASGLYYAGSSLEESFVPKSRVVVLGGYSNSDSTLPRNFATQQTILTGLYQSGSGNVRHVMRISLGNNLVVIDGLIIENGFAYGSGTNQVQLGGGIFTRNSTNVQIRNCLFRNNFAYSGGGAIGIIGGNPTLLNCIFLGNSTSGAGIAWIQSAAGARFINCIFAANQVSDRGAAAYIYQTNTHFINCTFFKNNANNLDLNGTLVGDVNATINVRNSIFHANSIQGNFEKADFSLTNSTLSLSNSITQNYRVTPQLTAANPRFRDTSNLAGTDSLFFTSDDGLAINLSCSPAINSGDNSYINPEPYDVAGQPRIFNGGTVDIGAYEAQQNIPTPFQTVYVDQNAATNGNGGSWANAYNDLQLALLSCADTIKIAAGEYYPSKTNSRTSFWLRNKAVILGGYSSGGGFRDPAIYRTILSGNLPQSNGQKSRKIIFANWVDSTCILDGIVIQNGFSDLWETENAAFRITNESNLIVNNTIFENNVGNQGSALQVDKLSTPQFLNCRFSNNFASDIGGAFKIMNLSSPRFFRCDFSNNSMLVTNIQDGLGGAGIVVNANATFDSCTFLKNFANWAGGAVFFKYNSNSKFSNCNFYGNNALQAGTDIYQEGGTHEYINCLFSDSTVTIEGGAIYSVSCIATYSDCRFNGGRATNGGAVMSNNSNETFTRCFFTSNYTSNAGGAICFIPHSTSKIINCVFSNNRSDRYGNAIYSNYGFIDIINSTLTKNGTGASSLIYNVNGTVMKIYNSILWANQPGLLDVISSTYKDIVNLSGDYGTSTSTISNSFTQVYGTNGVNNNKVGISPRLVNYNDPDGVDNVFNTADDGLRPAPCSPGINAGTNTIVTTIPTDISGNSRIVNDVVDIGAYEHLTHRDTSNVFYVSLNAIGNGSGKSWDNAYPLLRTGLENSCADTVKIAAGVYYPAVNSPDSLFSIQTGKVIFGGYPATGTRSEQNRDPIANPTILSGNVGNLLDSTDNSNNVLSFIYTDGKSTVDGLVIRDGYTRFMQESTAASGGGLKILGSDVTVKSCTITKNTAFNAGGIFVGPSTRFAMSKSIVENNVASFNGGGILFGTGSTIINCVIAGNRSGNSGGGVYTNGYYYIFKNVVFDGNTTNNGGGAAYNYLPNGFYYVNCTFVRNRTNSSVGGGIFAYQEREDQRANVYNSIFVGNTSTGGGLWAEAYYTVCNTYNSYCLYYLITATMLQSIPNTSGPVEGNPGFRNYNDPKGPDGLWMTNDDGLQLNPCSECINRGVNSAIIDIPNDIRDSARIRFDITDLGAYEYNGGFEKVGLLSTGFDSVLANKEFTDSAGWSHYFNHCRYLLSIRKNNLNIGSIYNGSLKIGSVLQSNYGSGQPVDLTTAAFNSTGVQLVAANRSWFVESNSTIPDSLLMRLPFSSSDFNDIRSQSPGLHSIEQLSLLKIKSSLYPYSLSTLPENTSILINDTLTSKTSYRYALVDSIHTVEFYIKDFGSGTLLSPTAPLNAACIIRSVKNGAWNDVSSWDKGIIPGSCDSVAIMPGHTITVNNSSQVSALFIAQNASLSMASSGIILQVGDSTESNSSLVCSGTISISDGLIIVNGRIRLTNFSNFTMSGGKIIIDGNNGTGNMSVPNGTHLFDVAGSNVQFNFLGGALQIIDPPYGLMSQTINSVFNFGDNSHLIFGDGVSITPSNNPNGFGGTLFPSRIGKFTFDGTTELNNRVFISVKPLQIKRVIEVRSGRLVQAAAIEVLE